MLKEWATQADFLIDLPDWQSKMEFGGQEHDVYEPDQDPLIYKLTKRNEFGLFPQFDSTYTDISLRRKSACCRLI